MGEKMKWTAFLIVCVLWIGSLHPFTALAAESPDKAAALKKGEKVEGSFGEPGEIHWYEIAPDQTEIETDSHMKIQLEGSFEGYISVYPNLDKAEQDETFDAYRSYITNGEPVEVTMPHAWKGPYYIKVEYFGHSEDMMDETEAPEPAYQITYEGERLPPSDLIGEACPAELSMDKRKSGSEILTQLRLIRDNVLAKTEKGKEISFLYYKAAPFLVSKLAFDKNDRDQVYKDLVTLQPLFEDIAKNGENSGHVITKEEQKAISSLYQFAIGHVPDSIRKQIEKIAGNMDIHHLADKKVSNIIKDNGLAAAAKKNKNRIIVKFKNEKGAKTFQQKSYSRILSQLKQNTLKPLAANGKTAIQNMYVLEAAFNVKKAASMLEELPEVEFAEPVYTYHKNAADIQYPYQWGLENTGKESGKQNGDIRYAGLKKLLNRKQLKKTVIAVVDTGVDYTLADLEGKVDKKSDFDFVNRDDDAYDDEGHGTHVAGIIAAEADNHYSMTGIHPDASILPVKVLDATGSGDSDKIALGIKYAVDNGAKVINLSLGGPESRVIEEVLKYAAGKGVTVVAASGNDGGEFLNYPASSKYTIAVGATNRLDIVSDLSNYGEGLDLAAPGVDIPSLLPNGNVTYLSGTSMAAPHVAAVAGLLLSANPSLKPDNIRHLVNTTADDIAVDNVNNSPAFPDDDFPGGPLQPGYDQASGWGRLNAWSALSALELGLSVNPLTDNDLKISGKAASGTQLELRNGDTLLGKGTAGEKGTFSFTIKPQKANEVLRLTAKKGAAEASVRVSVQETPPPEVPKVNQVSDLDTAVTGKAASGTTITVKSKNKTLGTAKTEKGRFNVKISKQKAGTVLYVTATSVSEKTSKAAKVVVMDKTPPVKPKIRAVSDRDTFVSGMTEAGATVYVKHKGKTIGQKKADQKGKFKVPIKKQKAGAVLYITAKDAAKNESKPAKTTVRDKTPPAVPKVKTITDRDQYVRGATEANATVYVKKQGKIIGKKKADRKGTFKIKIKKQKAGTVLYISAKDPAGNTSKAAKVTVKKYKK